MGGSYSHEQPSHSDGWQLTDLLDITCPLSFQALSNDVRLEEILVILKHGKGTSFL